MEHQRAAVHLEAADVLADIATEVVAGAGDAKVVRRRRVANIHQRPKLRLAVLHLPVVLMLRLLIAQPATWREIEGF